MCIQKIYKNEGVFFFFFNDTATTEIYTIPASSAASDVYKRQMLYILYKNQYKIPPFFVQYAQKYNISISSTIQAQFTIFVYTIYPIFTELTAQFYSKPLKSPIFTHFNTSSVSAFMRVCGVVSISYTIHPKMYQKQYQNAQKSQKVQKKYT